MQRHVKFAGTNPECSVIMKKTVPLTFIIKEVIALLMQGAMMMFCNATVVVVGVVVLFVHVRVTGNGDVLIALVGLFLLMEICLQG